MSDQNDPKAYTVVHFHSAAIAKHLKKLEENFSAARSVIDNIDGERSVLRRDLDQTRAKVADLEKQLERAGGGYSAVEAVRELEAERAALAAALDCANDHHTLKANCKRLVHSRNTAEQKFADANARLGELHTQLEQLTQENARLKGVVAEADHALNMARNIIDAAVNR